MSPAPLTPRIGTRGVALKRVLLVMRALREPRSLDWLAARFGVTTRTVRRDLDLLRSVGVPVCRGCDDGCWTIDRDRG